MTCFIVSGEPGKTTASGFLPRTPTFTALARWWAVQGAKFFGTFWASTCVCSTFILITAPPVDSLRLISGGLRCSAFTPFTPFGVPAAEYRSGLFRSKPARSVRSTFAGSRLRHWFGVVSASGLWCHWSIQVGCVKTTTTSADCQPARG